MSKSHKRIAAAALSVTMAGGLLSVANVAVAEPTATATPTKSPASPKATTQPTADPTKSPTASPETNKAIKTEFRDENGKANTSPKYERLSSGSTSLTSFGSLYADGKPLAGKEIAIYDYSGNKRGAKLGSGKTDANGKFRFTVSLPSGWSSRKDFNVEIRFSDPSGMYAEVSGVMKPQVDNTPGTPAPSKPGTPGHGLPKTGV